jgi:long-chain acyl-CoA synthetase
MGNTIASILLDAERAAAERPALYAGDTVLTFRGLADASRRMADCLSAWGVGSGDRVALVLPNSVGFVTAHYALAMLGSVIVPISPQAGRQMATFAMQKCGATCLITSETLVSTVTDLEQPSRAGVRTILVEEGNRALALRRADPAAATAWVGLHSVAPLGRITQVAADQPALIFFTSGTTGTPKGVLLTHAQVLFGVDAWANRWSFDPKTISLMAAPFFHVVYNPLVLGAHRRRGASVVQGDIALRAVTAAVERYRVTALMGTPALMRQLISAPRRHDLSSLTALIFGAAPTPAAIVRGLGEQFPGARRYNCYGMTETASALTCLAEDDMADREASVGKAHPGVALRIVDTQGNEVGVGQRGEVCAQGLNVVTSYFEAPDVDARRFHGSWLRTGDFGYLDPQGFLHLLDRMDDQINIDGEKFYPCQIEEVLAADPTVNEAVALGVSHPRKGQVVHAFVVAQPGHVVDVDALRKRCLEQLPVCAVPRQITILDQIPRNPTGKVLRRELASMPGA